MKDVPKIGPLRHKYFRMFLLLEFTELLHDPDEGCGQVWFWHTITEWRSWRIYTMRMVSEAGDQQFITQLGWAFSGWKNRVWPIKPF